MKDRIKKAIEKMWRDGEFERCYNFALTEGDESEAKAIAEYEEGIGTAIEGGILEDFPVIVLIHECRSYLLWQDIATYMLAQEGKE